MTYVPPAVLRYANGSPYAIVFDTTDDNHYHYDIRQDRLSWKNFFSDNLTPLNKLGRNLIEHFVHNNLTLHAKTPSPHGDYTMERGFEIKTYLHHHPCDSYVVIDDEIFPDFKDTIDMSKFIRTKSGTMLTKAENEGLTLDLANKAISILNSKGV